MPEETKKLTPVEIGKVLTHAAYKALCDFEDDAQISMDEIIDLIKETIEEVIAEIND